MIVTSSEHALSATAADRFPRDARTQIAFMGRSNVGKSSLINRLAGTKGLARTSKTPGRTREIHFYLINRRVYFVDLPGYGYAKVPRPMREEWRGFIEAYLEGDRGPDLAVVLVDARCPPTDLDRELVTWLRAAGLPHRIALTKIDKLPRSQHRKAATLAGEALALPAEEPPVTVSATTGDGLASLWRILDDVVTAAPTHPRTETTHHRMTPERRTTRP